MKLVIQRVNHAKLEIKDQIHSHINRGFVALLGISNEDLKNTDEKIKYLIQKLLNLRLFEKEKGFDLSIQEIKGDILLVSQFTLYAETKKGRRPDFVNALEPKKAKEIYEKFVKSLKNQYNNVETGVFAAEMNITLENNGPVTFILEK